MAWEGTGEMRGSLHCATHDEAVSSFGRDDAFLAWAMRTGKDYDGRQRSFIRSG